MPLDWTPPKDWIRITAIDAHTAGEPLRVITSGLPPIPGDTILAKRQYAQKHLDHLRTALMWEPRGHADMYGCIVTEPVTAEGTLGVLFLHNEGFSTMCGHGVIGLAKVGLDTGMIKVEGDHPVIRIDTPAGRVTAFARRENSRVVEVSFHEVDRSPTGTGVSARAALHFARGEIKMNEPFVVESILGTCFTGEVVETTTFGPHTAVIPKVTGTAYITGRNELLIDPDDPLRHGFILR